MAGKGDEKDQAIIDLTQRMMKLMDEFNLASSSKVHFKALKPGVYSIDDTISLEDFLVKFEKYCAIKFGLGDEDSWSSALGELLTGEIKNAYTNMSEVVEIEEVVKHEPVPAIIPVEVEAVTGNVSLRPNGTKRSCTHCKRDGHLMTTCWLLHPDLKVQRCNLPGHFANVCPNARVAIAPPQSAGTVAIPSQIVSPPQQLNNNMMCIGCGKSGADFHLLPKCPVMIAWWGNAPTVRANSSRVAAIEEAGADV
ncbi:unnamed protein product, partial [Rotaria magnacalcarata]